MTTHSRYALILAAALAVSGCASRPAQEAPLESDATAFQRGEDPDAGLDTQAQDQPASPEAAELPPDHLAARRLIHFEFDRATIDSREQALIAEHARYIARNPDLQVRLEGHADERGTPEYNVSLGERRALAVKRLLLIAGVTPDQVALTSYGEQLPAVRGASEASYAENRRVEFNYLNGPLAEAPLSYEAPRLAAMDGRADPLR